MTHREDEQDDPITRQMRIDSHERMLDSLFYPIFDESGPQYNLSWVVEGLLAASYLTLLAAPPKAGKTSLATAIALAVATGTPFAGRPTNQGAVLWIAAEENPVERNELLRQSPLATPETPLFTCYQPLKIDDAESLSYLAHWVRQVHARLVVVDPLLGATAGRSLHDSWAARRTLKELKAFCHAQRIAALVLQHDKRGESALSPRRRAADNAQLSATASMSMILKNEQSAITSDGKRESRLIALSCSGRGNWSNGIHHLISHGPLDYGTCIDVHAVIQEHDLTPTERKIVEALANGPLSATEFIGTYEAHAGTVRNALTHLRRKGIILVKQVLNRSRIYELRNPV